jgi:signal transduction histidine kinase
MIFAGVLAAGILASVVLLWQTLIHSHEYPIQQIQAVRENFLLKHEPIAFLSLDDLPQSKFGLELIEPETGGLPRTFVYPENEILPLYRYATTCRKSPHLGNDSSLVKALRWHQFLCGNRGELPESFFSTPPYLHPSGASFVKLAYELGGPTFRDSEWLTHHRRYLHLSELGALKGKLGGLSFSEKLLSGLQAPWLNQLLANRSPVLTDQYVMFRDEPHSDGYLANRYRVFERSVWQSYLFSVPFVLVPFNKNSICVLAEGNGCWQYRPERELPFRLLLALLFCSIFVLLSMLVWLVVQKRKNERIEQEGRLFILQTLTHELRTPATGLRLSLENLRRHFDSLPEIAQTHLLRMSDEIHRLIRVVEGSRAYLDTEQGRIQLKMIEIASPNEFVSAVLEPFVEAHGINLVRFVPVAPGHDNPVRIDPYWASLCIRNLVDNAFNHGTPPVTISLTREPNNLRLTVSDEGSAPCRDFRELTRRGRSSREKKGLGLGLSLVHRVSDLMGSEIEFSNRPTTFSILIGYAL